MAEGGGGPRERGEQGAGWGPGSGRAEQVSRGRALARAGVERAVVAAWRREKSRARAPRDLCLHSRGHGGTVAVASRDDSSPRLEPKAAAAAAAAVPAVGWGTAGLGGRGEAANP